MVSTSLYRELLKELSLNVPYMPDMPEETPENILRALWHFSGGRPLAIDSAAEMTLMKLDETAARKLRKLVFERIKGVPTAYITGRQKFMGLEILAGRGALIPRKETELLANSAVEKLRKLAAHRDDVFVMDVCTGSGNIALALAYHVPQARVFASDLSSDAVRIAKSNVRHFELESRIEVREGNLFSPFENHPIRQKIDMITCNPPYISSRKLDKATKQIINHEPRMAFDGGSFGINFLNRFIKEAPSFLRPGGWIAIEVGIGQGKAVSKRIAADFRFREIKQIKDNAGEIRGIMASTQLAKKAPIIE